MKPNIILFIALIFSTNVSMSQSVDHEEGGQYLKTVEYNVIMSGEKKEFDWYNLKHKSIIDRIFFGIKNSFVEFVFLGSPEGITRLQHFASSKTCMKILTNWK